MVKYYSNLLSILSCLIKYIKINNVFYLLDSNVAHSVLFEGIMEPSISKYEYKSPVYGCNSLKCGDWIMKEI